MKQSANKWIDEVMNSLEGSRRAEPPASLLTKIEAELSRESIARIPVKNLRWLMAAAVLLLSINLISLRIAQAERQHPAMNVVLANEEVESLLPTYILYE
ncbi:MAG: hypothetical protein AAF433_04435 [Bacteroidota bacterium]